MNWRQRIYSFLFGAVVVPVVLNAALWVVWWLRG